MKAIRVEIACQRCRTETVLEISAANPVALIELPPCKRCLEAAEQAAIELYIQTETDVRREAGERSGS